MAEHRWIVECEDLFGRERGLTVLTHSGWVVMVTPAGESAVLSIPQLDRLVRALDAAASASGQNGLPDPARPPALTEPRRAEPIS